MTPAPNAITARLQNVFNRLGLRGPTSAPLLPCTDTWGGFSLHEHEPAIEEHLDAIYTPYTDQGAWGAYKADGRIIQAGVNFRGPERIAKQPTANIAPEPYPFAEDSAYLYAGAFNAHFGHFLVDVLPRLWALDRYRKLKILYHADSTPADWFAHRFITAIFGTLDLTLEDFAVFDRPTRLKRLIVPHTSLREHAFAHRTLATLGQTIGARLVSAAPPTTGRPVYLSKTRLASGVWGFVNEVEVETVLRARGVEIVYPETLSLRDQVRLLSGERAILATTSSALHASLFGAGARIIALNPSPEVVSTFRLIDTLSGARVSYVHEPGAARCDGDSRFQVTYRLSDPHAVGEALYRLALSEP